MKRTAQYFYKRNDVIQTSGYLTREDREYLKHLANEADKSLTRYVTRLLQTHIKQEREKRKITP